MAIALLGPRGFFSHKKKALRHVEGKRVALTRGVHQALADFQWLAEDLSRRPTRPYDLVPLQPDLDSYHNTSRYMYGGAVLPGPTSVPRTPQPQPSAADTSLEPAGAHPIIWWAHFAADFTAQLIS